MEDGSLACLGAVQERSVMAGRGLNDGCLGTTDDILAPRPPIPLRQSPVANLWARCEPGRPPRLWAVSNMGVMSRPPARKGKDHPCAGHTRQAETQWVGRINQPSALPLTWTRPAKEALPF